MQMNQYQGEARSFAIYPRASAVVYPALGLVGEAGEVAEKIKKVIRDVPGADLTDLPHDTKWQIAKEIGDVLWYCANLAHDLGFTLDEIANINLMKLSDRKDRNVLKGSGDNR